MLRGASDRTREIDTNWHLSIDFAIGNFSMFCQFLMICQHYLQWFLHIFIFDSSTYDANASKFLSKVYRKADPRRPAGNGREAWCRMAYDSTVWIDGGDHDDEDDGDTAHGVLSGDNLDSVLLHQWPTCSFNTCICSELGWYRHRNDNEWPDGDN